jgi:hypothetical protein
MISIEIDSILGGNSIPISEKIPRLLMKKHFHKPWATKFVRDLGLNHVFFPDGGFTVFV